MKISGCIFQRKKIKVDTSSTFEAYYKNYHFYISSDHGLGKPKYDHLTRYNIVVRGSDGGYAVDTYEDCHNIRDAIRHALQGACLIDNQ